MSEFDLNTFLSFFKILIEMQLIYFNNLKM